MEAQENHMGLRDIHSVTRWGIAGTLSAVLLSYSGHWWGKAIANEKHELAAYRSEIIAKNAEQTGCASTNILLEIRGVGLAVNDWHQSSVWREIAKKATISHRYFRRTLKPITRP